MIELRINGIPLDIDPSASVSLEVNNPIFSDEVIPGTYSLPFDLPATSHNRRLLNFPELINVAQKPALKFKNVDIRIDGVPWKRGELIFRGFSNKKYRVNFMIDTSNLVDLFNDLNLSDLDHQVIQLVDWSQIDSGWSYPGWETVGRKYIEFQVAFDALPNPFSVNINGQEFSDGDPASGNRLYNVTTLVNRANKGVEMRFIDGLFVNNHIIRIWANNPGMDQPFDITLQEEDLEAPVWNITASYLDTYNPLVIAAISNLFYNSQDIELDDFVAPTIQIDGFYSDDDSALSLMTSVFNMYENNTYLFNKDGQHFGFIPMYSLKYIFRKIKEKTGVGFTGDFIEDPDFAKLIFANFRSLEWFENGTVTYTDRVNPIDHLPDMTVNDLLLQLKKLFCLGSAYYAESNQVEIFKLKNLINAQDYAESPKFSPDYDIEYNLKSGITLSYKWDDGDGFSKTLPLAFQPYVIGAGEIKQESEISTMLMETRSRPGADAEYKIPVAIQEGSWSNKKPDAGSARLLFFYGNQNDSLGEIYKYASSDNYNLTGQKLGAYGLYYHGFSSLYETCWKGWAEFLMNDIPSSRVAYWSIVDLLNFDWKKKYRIDQVRYFIKKLSFTVTGRINPIDVELMKAE